jgi:SAM-dependent MidA family methyltransferase
MIKLHEIIRHEIARKGPMPFARFMELALYQPELGYYERDPQQVGRLGDFYTSVSVGSLFGELLGFQFAVWMESLASERGQLVEAGAHDGRLAADILNYLRAHRPHLLKGIDYWIVEPSSRRQEWQQRTLHNAGHQVRWFKSLEALPPSGVSGIIFSNEFLDALPVRRFVWDATARLWFEFGVTVNDGEFTWTKMFASSIGEKLSLPGEHLPGQMLAMLPDGFTTEISPIAIEWWRRAAGCLSCGYLLTLDYGLQAGQFFSPERREGTIRAYYRQHLTKEVLANVGEQDITAHINFTALREAGEAAGLKTIAFLSQEQFLIQIAQQTCREDTAFSPWSSARARQFQTLTHPGLLGRSFQALIQGRNGEKLDSYLQ